MQPIGRMAEKKIEQPVKTNSRRDGHRVDVRCSVGPQDNLLDFVTSLQLHTLWYEVVKAIQRKHYVVIYTRSANKAPRPASL